MTIIEGIGDEVTYFMLVLVACVVAVVAWLSTRIIDPPFFRTVLILERRSRQRLPIRSVTRLNLLAGRGSTNNTRPVEVTQTPNEIVNNQESATSTCEACDKENGATQRNSRSEISETSEVNEASSPEISGATSSVNNTTETNSSAVQNHESDNLRRRGLTYLQSRLATFLENTERSSASIQPRADVIQEQDNVHHTEPSPSSDSEESIRIRLIYLNDDQKLVEGRLQEQLGDFKRRHFGLELAADKLVRLIFNGQVLQSDDQTLQACGLFDNCVVHCLVHQQRNISPRSQPESSSSTPQRDWDLTNVMFLSFSFLIAIAWYCRVYYSYLFNATTTVALLGLTGILGVSIMGMLVPGDENNPRQQRQ